MRGDLVWHIAVRSSMLKAIRPAAFKAIRSTPDACWPIKSKVMWFAWLKAAWHGVLITAWFWPLGLLDFITARSFRSYSFVAEGLFCFIIIWFVLMALRYKAYWSLGRDVGVFARCL